MAHAGNPSITTRKATTADGPRCAEIFLAARRNAFPWQPAERFGLDDFYDCTEDELVLVADVNGEIAGFVSIDLPDHFLHTLFVDPAWQHRGIGSILLRAAVACLEGRVELACAERNAPARAFFERHGLREVPRPDGSTDPHVVYRRADRGAF